MQRLWGITSTPSGVSSTEQMNCSTSRRRIRATPDDYDCRFPLGPELKIERVIEFRKNVDLIDDWIQQSDGCLASRPFTPHRRRRWFHHECLAGRRLDAERVLPGRCSSNADRPSQGGERLRPAVIHTVRILETCGQWNGRNPLTAS
jgi:hypothetical protein